jgi:hypothetical protein
LQYIAGLVDEPSSDKTQFRASGCRFSGPLQIERQQPFKDLLVAQIMRPTVGIKNGGIQALIRQVEPGGTETSIFWVKCWDTG